MNSIHSSLSACTSICLFLICFYSVFVFVFKGITAAGNYLEKSQQLTEDEMLRIWSTLYYGKNIKKTKN